MNACNDSGDVRDFGGCTALLNGSGTPLPVTFESPCSCYGEHGKWRWSAKNDSALPPADASAIQAVTPSDMYGWAELGRTTAVAIGVGARSLSPRQHKSMNL